MHDPFAEPAFAPVVGNDVVDLEDPRCSGKHLDARFLGRVFAPEERAAISAASAPAVALWVRWAAKEAAYKVVTKLLGAPPPFTHAAFVVEETSANDGVVRYGRHRVPFRLARGDSPLHVVAVGAHEEAWPAADGEGELRSGVAPLPTGDGARTGELAEPLRSRFTSRELAAIHTLPSALVRLEARAELSRMLDVAERRLEIICEFGVVGRSPPVVLLDGQGTHADVSLSHHGNWLGWSVLVRQRGAG